MVDLQTIENYERAVRRLRKSADWHLREAESWLEELIGAFNRADDIAMLLADDLYEAHRAEAARLGQRVLEECDELEAMIAEYRSGGDDR